MSRRAEGYVHITVVLDDVSRTGNPNPATWAGWHNLTHPVLADGSWAFASSFAPQGSFGIPAYTVLDRELRVQRFAAGSPDSNLIDSLLDEPIPSVDWPLP